MILRQPAFDRAAGHNRIVDQKAQRNDEGRDRHLLDVDAGNLG